MEIRLYLKAESARNPNPNPWKAFLPSSPSLERKFFSWNRSFLSFLSSFLLLFSLYWRRYHQFGYVESQSAGYVITFILNSTFCTATATKTFRSHEICSGLWSFRKPDKFQIRQLGCNHWFVSNLGYWTVGLVWMRERDELGVSVSWGFWDYYVITWKSAKLLKGTPLRHSLLNFQFSRLWAFQHMLVSTRRRVSLWSRELFPPDRHIFVNDYSWC